MMLFLVYGIRLLVTIKQCQHLFFVLVVITLKKYQNIQLIEI